ncbi:unnamed protein product [Peronospora destructor]|uniref:Vesicle transport protein n=1 Tax=Peronospora destructor TaxID=86335 RepID=A0AAV0UGJ9_9STRA|nr:unnamed protein product [Peronospora destructor]
MENQIKVVIHGARDKVTGIANDASTKVASVVTDKKSGTKANTTPSDFTSDSLPTMCSSLSKKQRLTGFMSCFILGFFVSIGSTVVLMVGSDNGTKFGITYSLGSIISLCSSGFLVGPKQQVKLMFKPVRCIATILYLVMIVVVLTVAIAAPQLGLVVLLLVLIQSTAAVWYSASYILHGRTILARIAKKVCGTAV